MSFSPPMSIDAGQVNRMGAQKASQQQHPRVLPPTSATVLDPNTPWRHLDDALLEDGLLKVHPASFYAAIPWDELRVWCHFRGVYSLPTHETVGWMRTFLQTHGNPSTLEVGAGRGWLGRALGLRMTDNYCQVWPSVALLYAAQGQPPTEYGPDVERIAALPAVKKYQPEAVFGCWVTQLWPKEVQAQPGGGSMHGIDEEDLLSRVKWYIVVGNDNVHGQKKIMKRPHEVVRADWLWPRAQDASKNAIYIWKGQG